MNLLPLAWASLMNRRVIAGLTALSIALSVVLLLGVEKVREGARETFLATISGTDLIVGARTSGVPLLLYSVFHLGDPSNEIRIETYEAVAARREVAWAVPIALGDGHRGDRVVGTTSDYFEHIRTGPNRPLTFAEGKPFADLFDIVIGADVARRLGYDIGTPVVLSHGTGAVDFSNRHEDLPFIVSGILAPTGTPIDRSLMVSLEAIEAIHEGSSDADALRAAARPPSTVTAVFVGARSPILTFGLQRFLNGYEGEPITAVLPGVAFAQLWSIVGQVETALLAISGMVVITACIGLAVAMLSSLEGRRREMAILRAVGAGPSSILTLFLFEALLVTVGGILLGLALTYGTLALLLPVLESRLGITLTLSAPSLREWLLLAAVGSGGIIAGLIPAWRATRMSLADGLTVRA